MPAANCPICAGDGCLRHRDRPDDTVVCRRQIDAPDGWRRVAMDDQSATFTRIRADWSQPCGRAPESFTGQPHVSTIKEPPGLPATITKGAEPPVSYNDAA